MKAVLIAELQGHKAPIYKLEYSEEKNLLYSSSSDKLLASWDLHGLKNVPGNIVLPHSSFAFSLYKNRHLWVGTNPGNIHVIDLEQKRELRNFDYHQNPVSAVWTDPNSDRIYSADHRGNLAVWDAEGQKNLAFMPLSGSKIRSLGMIQENLWVGHANGSIEILDASSLSRIGIIRLKEDDSSVNCFIQENNAAFVIAGTKNGFLHFLDANNPTKQLKLPAHNYAIYGLCQLNDGLSMVSISRDKSIKVWNRKELSVEQKITGLKDKGHTRSVNAICKISETRFASAGDDARILIWELQ